MPGHSKGLGSLTAEEFGALKSGFEATNPAVSTSLGNISNQNVMGALSTLGSFALDATPFGQAVSAANIAGNISAEKAAASALGRDPSISSAVLGDTITGFFGAQPSAMSQARDKADTNQDGRVSTTEAQSFAQQFGGMTAYGVGIDMSRPSVSMSRSFSAREADKGFTGPSDVGIGPSGPTGGFTGPSGVGIGPTGGFTSAPSTTSASISDRADAIPDEAPSAPAAETKGSESSGGGTFICTVIHERGDMSKTVYRYDQSYGSSVNRNIFDGYAVWGQPLASLMRRNKTVYNIAKPIALSWANQMAYDKSGAVAGKRSITGKLAKYIGEPLCYAIGFIVNRRRKWLKSA